MGNGVSIGTVYEELKRIEQHMATKEDLERFMETVVVLSNKDTMKQISQSEKDIREGRIKAVRSVGDL